MRRTLTILLFFLAGCSTNQRTDFGKLTDDLLYGTLALSPVSATQTGYHEHNGMQLDEMLDDYSAAGIDAQRKFYEGMQSRVNGVNTTPLDKEQHGDLAIIKQDPNLPLTTLNNT